VARTDGPTETLASFVALRDALERAIANYLARPTQRGVVDIGLILANLRTLIYLEAVPVANRHRIGDTTVFALLDIFGRIDLPAV
jgi:hypothetical protein